MSVDGVWVLEVAGVYGWERVSTVFLEKGRYLGGGPVFFTQGSYVTDGNKIKFSLNITRHGAAQTVFGEKRERFSTEVNAKIKKRMIKGHAKLKGAHSSVAKQSIRLLRRADLTAIPKKSKK